MKLFLDSCALIARAIENDTNHEAAKRVFHERSQRKLPYRLLYTSNLVVDETLTFLLYRAGARGARRPDLDKGVPECPRASCIRGN